MAEAVTFRLDCLIPIPTGCGSLSLPSRASQDDARGGVLKKAVSFRNDLKSRIARKSVSSTETAITKPVKKKTSFARSGSFNDSERVSSMPKKNDDGVEKPGVDTAKVFRGLRYIQDAVDKGILELFHGSVTIVLDQIAELKSVIQKCFSNQESARLRSEFGALHQNLAKLMGLSDPLLLSSEATFINKQEATDLISSIKSSIEELVNLTKENDEYLRSRKSSSENRDDISDFVYVNFEPDLSITLDDSAISTPSINAKSRSAENLLNVGNTQDRSVDEVDINISVDVPADDMPPPKPPLPHYLWDVGKYNSMPKGFSLRHGADENPPPLPEKKRNSAGIYEVNVTSSRLPISYSQNLKVYYHHSPTNSVSSAFSGSSEEILNEPPAKPSRIPTSGSDRRDSRSSQYDNMNDSSFEYSSPSDFADIAVDSQHMPPPVPAKQGSTSFAGGGMCLGSPYDNVFEHASSFDIPFETGDGFMKLSPTLSSRLLSPKMPLTSLQSGELISSASSNQTIRKYVSKVSEVHKKTYSGNVVQSCVIKSSAVNYTEVSSTESSHVPPPIPPKKHVQAYLSAFGEWSSSSLSCVRHTVQASTLDELCPQIDENLGISYRQGLPCRVMSLQNSFPSIYANSDGITILSKSSSEDTGLNPPLPPKQRDQSSSRSTLDSGYYSTVAINNQAIMTPESNSGENKVLSPDSDSRMSFSLDVSSTTPDVSSCSVAAETTGASEVESLIEVDVLVEEEVTNRLVFKQPNDDGPDVRGGSVDVLIVHATTPGPNDNQFKEAFLMTYRTFISPCDLIKKLLQRYNQFSKADDVKKKKLARHAYSFLMRVVDDLCQETNKEMLQILMDFVCQLLNDGELQMAKVVRTQVLDKSENYRVKQAASHSTTLLSSYKLTAKKHSIIDFKADYIAEQMTLLDAELFNKIEIPEVLRWSREQSEEHSPNLTTFTEHFNKMSYWCRTRILEQPEPKERERHLIKFIKVMKHLRRLNNFNSYLAILSAVDSAPVRRLEWQKQNVEALKEFCELIDSSSSFRAYRQALSEATSPCIPYIGLVLQDLTFVNVGNVDCLPDRNINFSKCWQYFTILQNMSRFRKCNYGFKKNEKIIAFFNNFDYYLSEESLWQLSEMIKPRGGKAPVKQTD